MWLSWAGGRVHLPSLRALSWVGGGELGWCWFAGVAELVLFVRQNKDGTADGNNAGGDGASAQKGSGL